MSETKFTPGPWHCDEQHVWAGDDQREGAITMGGCGCCNGWSEGVFREEDAHLIAAAPELYAALTRCLNFIENTEGEIGETLESGDLARAALAKARGEA